MAIMTHTTNPSNKLFTFFISFSSHLAVTSLIPATTSTIIATTHKKNHKYLLTRFTTLVTSFWSPYTLAVCVAHCKSLYHCHGGRVSSRFAAIVVN